jgi:hypothetical protein
VLAAGAEAEPRDRRFRRRRRFGKSVDACDEFQILAHGQVVIEAEALGHVADPALDLVGAGADVESEAGATARIRGQQPAQHADRRRLAGAVGAEEAVNGSALHLQRQVAHHLAPAERLAKAFDVDGDFGSRCHGAVS